MREVPTGRSGVFGADPSCTYGERTILRGVSHRPHRGDSFHAKRSICYLVSERLAV